MHASYTIKTIIEVYTYITVSSAFASPRSARPLFLRRGRRFTGGGIHGQMAPGTELARLEQVLHVSLQFRLIRTVHDVQKVSAPRRI